MRVDGSRKERWLKKEEEMGEGKRKLEVGRVERRKQRRGKVLGEKKER